MKTLNNNWVTEGLNDFEYKKYVLLAYLQDVNKHFSEVRLYPQLADLVQHYKSVVQLKNDKKTLFLNFPQKLTKADFENFVLEYESMVVDDAAMDVVAQILDFAIDNFSKTLKEGRMIYQEVENKMQLEPVGLMPLRNDEGYFFLKFINDADTRVYSYKVSFFESADEKFRSLKTEYVDTVQKNTANTFESLKLEVIKRFPLLPNPATYVVESKLKCAIEETVLPIAKRLLVRTLAA